MTLEEAIAHYLELAEENEKDAEQFKRIKATQDMISHCYECAEEHRRLADWLRELVNLRNITEYLRDFIDCFGSMDSMYYNEDIIKWAEEELRVEMREVNADATEPKE